MSKYEICLHYMNYLSRYNNTWAFRSLVDAIIKSEMDNDELVGILHMQWLETVDMYERGSVQSVNYTLIGIMSPDEYLSKVLQSVRDNKISEILDGSTNTGELG
jgi:hypothetical protein